MGVLEHLLNAEISEDDIACIQRLIRMFADGTVRDELRNDFLGVANCFLVAAAALTSLIRGYEDDEADTPPVFGSDSQDADVVELMRELGDAIGVKQAFTGPLNKEFFVALFEFLLTYFAGKVGK